MRITETGRLIVRCLEYQDAPELTDILSDPEVMKYSVRGVCDRAATVRFIDWCRSCYEAHGLGPWALIDKSGGDLVGFCGLGPEPVGDVEEMNLGYRLARHYWGRGLATEAVRAVLAYGFGSRSVESVTAIIEPENRASIRVAEKAGFSHYQGAEFHGRSVRLYRLSAGEWPVA